MKIVDDKRMIAIKIMGFDADGNVSNSLITIPPDRFEQLQDNSLFYDYICKKIMNDIREKARDLNQYFLTIEEVLEKLGYNECPFEEDKICVDKKKLSEFVDKKKNL